MHKYGLSLTLFSCFAYISLSYLTIFLIFTYLPKTKGEKVDATQFASSIFLFHLPFIGPLNDTTTNISVMTYISILLTRARLHTHTHIYPDIN